MSSIRIEARRKQWQGSLVWWGEADAARARLIDLLKRTAERPEQRWPMEGWEMETNDVECPNCQAMNIGRKIYIRLEDDERGPHYECSACSHAWPLEVKK